MFNKKLNGIGTGSSFVVSVVLVLSGIFLFVSDTTVVVVLMLIGFIAICFAVCIWISLYRQWDERRLEERVKNRMESKS
jgi:Na+/proline symporter